MMQQTTLGEQIQAGKAEFEGDAGVLRQLASTLVAFDPLFEMMPGTGAKDLTPNEKPFQQEQPGDTSGG